MQALLALFWRALTWLGLWKEPDPFEDTTISAPDGSIRATFIGLGATLTELWVPDRADVMRDVVLGYDDRSKWLHDPAHPVFGAIVGRVAGRIARGKFNVDGKEYTIPTNDFSGRATLHGGNVGWDRRTFTRISRTPSSVHYRWVDVRCEGFPGTVTCDVEYRLRDGGIWETSVRCRATERTPIIVTSHVYWNLDGFASRGPSSVLDHTAQIDASRTVAVSSDDFCPTGELPSVSNSPWDFRKPHTFASRHSEILKGGSNGYNDCWVYDAPISAREDRDGFSLWSEKSGIRLDARTNQGGVVVYTGNYLGETPRKAVHGPGGSVYAQYEGVAVEQQGLCDAVNHPEWGREDETIFGPGKDSEWRASYRFSVIPAAETDGAAH